MICLQLFLSFLQVGLFSIGGGYAAMPLIQEQMVDNRGWLTMSEFADLITIAEMTPGPIAVNAATFVGMRIGGIPGAVVATFGCILPSLILVSVLFYIYHKYHGFTLMENVLAALRASVVALILTAGLELLKTAVISDASGGICMNNMDWLNATMFIMAFIVMRYKKWNPILVMCLCGVLRLVLSPLFVLFA